MQGLVILGTRPEAIKLIPVIERLNNSNIPIKILSTEQHSEAVNQLFKDNGLFFDYKIDNCSSSNLPNQVAYYLSEFSRLLENETFDFIITQGDTLSAYAGMLHAYLSQIDFIYIESGLRTYDLNNPYPEEGLRVMMSHIAKINFVPTIDEKEYLLKENIGESKIIVVGNTGIDYISKYIFNNNVNCQKNTILLTVHRRENWDLLDAFFSKLNIFLQQNKEIKVIYPMHFNHFIQKLAIKYFSNSYNVKLLKPLKSNDFYKYLQVADLIITDSGGVQEETSYLNKKMIVLRNKTERYYKNEMICNVSIDDDKLFNTVTDMLKRTDETQDFNYYYGDGQASSRIVEWIKKEYTK